MTTPSAFVQPAFPTRHAGVERVVRAGRALRTLSPGGSVLLLAALAGAVAVVAGADRAIDAWTALGAIACAAMALLLGPVRRLAAGVRRTARRLDATRRAALAAQQQWQTGLADAALLAEISRSGGSAPFR